MTRKESLAIIFDHISEYPYSYQVGYLSGLLKHGSSDDQLFWLAKSISLRQAKQMEFELEPENASRH